MILYNEGELIVFKDLAGDVYLGRISIRWTDSEGKIRYCVRDTHNDPRYQTKRIHDVAPERIIGTGCIEKWKRSRSVKGSNFYMA